MGQQNGRFPQGMQPTGPTINVQGKLVRLNASLLEMTESKGAQLVVQIAPNAKTRLTGTAEAGALKPGMGVDFTAELNKQYSAAQDVGALTICDVDKADPEKKPIFKPVSEADPFPFRDAKDKDATFAFHVRGTVKSYKNGLLIVAADKATVKAQVSADAKIDVSQSDLAPATAGDDVTVDGQQMRPGQIMASSVEVKLAKPLAAPSKKGSKK